VKMFEALFDLTALFELVLVWVKTIILCVILLAFGCVTYKLWGKDDSDDT